MDKTSIKTSIASSSSSSSAKPLVKTFFGLAPVELRTLYQNYLESVSYGYAPSQIEEELAVKMQTLYSIPQDNSVSIASRLAAEFSSPQFTERFFETSSVPTRAQIYASDLASFRTHVLSDPTATSETSALLLSFIIHFRLNFHPSGWIKYDRKSIFYLSGVQLKKLRSFEQECLTNYLHTHYNINMRVVGSNTPTPCYNIDWLATVPPVEDQLIDLGPLEPSTTISYIMSMTKGDDHHYV